MPALISQKIYYKYYDYVTGMFFLSNYFDFAISLYFITSLVVSIFQVKEPSLSGTSLFIAQEEKVNQYFFSIFPARHFPLIQKAKSARDRLSPLPHRKLPFNF